MNLAGPKWTHALHQLPLPLCSPNMMLYSESPCMSS